MYEFKWNICLVFVDIPSSPQDVWINNVEFRTYIHWKAPLHPGGLQLNYAIKGKCKNASNLTQLPKCEQESITLCEVIDHGPDNDQFVCKVTAILHQFAIPVPPQITYSPIIYLAFVEASNELGFRRSNPVEFTIELGFNVLLSKYSILHDSQLSQSGHRCKVDSEL